MKKVLFDTSGAIAFRLRLGRDLPPDELKPVKVEGWLVDDHLCIRKPKTDSEGMVPLAVSMGRQDQCGILCEGRCDRVREGNLRAQDPVDSDA